MDLKKFRLKSIMSPPRLNAPPRPRALGGSNSGYSILDQFINQIMPMIQNQGPSALDLHEEGLMKKQQHREDRIRQDEQTLNRRPAALPQIARAIQEPQKPMNTVIQGVSPYQEATLAMRNKEFEARDTLARDKQTEVERKNQATEEEKKKRLELLTTKEGKNDLSESEAVELKFLKDMEKIRTGQRFTTGRDEILQKGRETIVDKQATNTMAQIDKRGVLEKEYIALRNDNSKQAVERKAEIDRELAAEKPESSTQQKTGIQLKYNRLINEHPEYRDFLKLNEDGMVEVLPVGEERFGPDQYGPTEEVRKKILDYLGMGGEAPVNATTPSSVTPPFNPEKAEPPPSGMAPGGKWIVTKSGKRIYQEPD